MKTWLLLLAAIACEVTASLSLKGALDHSPLYGVVAVGYLGSFVLLDAVLRRGMALGVAYGIWGALGVAATAALSALIYGENVTGLMSVGVALVIGGVLVVEFGSHRASSKAQER
ncbi:SMR family transporter [soil metagenome]